MQKRQRQGLGFKAALTLAKKKGGIERALVLDDALVSLPEEMLSKNHQIMREIIALDADGKAGLRRKYLHTVQLKDASEYLEGMLAAHMENREGPQALAKLEAVIAQPKDVMHHQLALYLKGMIIMDTTGNVGDALAALARFQMHFWTTQAKPMPHEQFFGRLFCGCSFICKLLCKFFFSRSFLVSCLLSWK